ncbi:MAG: hypothetical protein ABIL09_12585 [Gemmatimonadota bacterium]
MAHYTTPGTVAPALPELTVPDALLDALKATEPGQDALALHPDPVIARPGEAPWLALWRAFGGAWRLEPDGLVFLYVEEHIHEALADLLQLVLRQAPAEIPYLTLTYALYCDRRVADGFGGGACLITREQIRWWGTGTWLAQQIQALDQSTYRFTVELASRRARRAPQVEEMADILARGARTELRQRYGEEVWTLRVEAQTGPAP